MVHEGVIGTFWLAQSSDQSDPRFRIHVLIVTSDCFDFVEGELDGVHRASLITRAMTRYIGSNIPEEPFISVRYDHVFWLVVGQILSLVSLVPVIEVVQPIIANVLVPTSAINTTT
jgi:hypothetical protein